MSEAVDGVRIYDIIVSHAPGAVLNSHEELMEGVEVKCKFEVAQKTPIWIDSEESDWNQPSGECEGAGETEGKFGKVQPGTVSKISFIVCIGGTEQTVFTHLVDPPFSWELQELTEAQVAKLAADKVAYQKQQADEAAERERKLAELNSNPVPIKELIGDVLIRPQGEGPRLKGGGWNGMSAMALLGQRVFFNSYQPQWQGNELIAVYFSAHWCAPCCAFTPILAEAYEAAKAAREAFEVIFASSDHDQDAFRGYFKAMPWVAMPHGAPEIAALKERFMVEGIPCLVVLRADGTIVTTDGTEEVSANGVGAIQTWIAAQK